MRRLMMGLLLVGSGCGGASLPEAHTPAGDGAPVATVPLGRAEDHFHTVSVRVSDHVVTTFILDTGIGLPLVSRALCERIGCVESGEFEGRRMSGQSVRVPLTTIPVIELGDYVQRDVVAGIIDIPGFFPEPAIEGFLGLPFFRDAPFTIDPVSRTLTVESDDSTRARARDGIEMPVRLEVDGPAVDAFAVVVLSSGERADVLMDTGSRGVTLHPRYASALGIDLEGADVRRQVGEDETAHAYTRYFTTLEGLSFGAAPAMPRTQLRVMFQEIIHDGLIGTDVMSSFVMTFDVARSRVILAEPRRDLAGR